MAWHVNKEKVEVCLQMKKKSGLLQEIWKARYIYILICPVIIWLIIFEYVPMHGILMAFKKFKISLGVFGSPWIGLDNFKKIFVTPIAVEAIFNTLEISFGRLLFQFPMGLIVALILTEMCGKRTKKICQVVLTFPHFLSWVIVANIMISLLSTNGVVNNLLRACGLDPVRFLGKESLFRPLLYITANWKEAGWASILYLAAIAGIDPALYEAAEIDGASRLRRIWHVTLPCIRTTIAVLFILEVGGIMNAGFDQIFNMRNSMVANTSRILDTYVYDITFGQVPNYGFSTAVGLFKSVINLLLLITANKLTRWLTGEGMFR